MEIKANYYKKCVGKYKYLTTIELNINKYIFF